MSDREQRIRGVHKEQQSAALNSIRPNSVLVTAVFAVTIVTSPGTSPHITDTLFVTFRSDDVIWWMVRVCVSSPGEIPASP